QVAEDIAAALAYMHNHRQYTGVPVRIIHRDIKPGNVMFDKRGTAKLVDFSMAGVLEFGHDERPSMNETFDLTGDIGNCRFMAPEVARKEHYNEKADIYSFGLLLWEMITLQQPYMGLLRCGTPQW
ncbi:kinase-like domain-containing protein, partial [Tribonema minus]